VKDKYAVNLEIGSLTPYIDRETGSWGSHGDNAFKQCCGFGGSRRVLAAGVSVLLVRCLAADASIRRKACRPTAAQVTVVLPHLFAQSHVRKPWMPSLGLILLTI